MSVTTIERAVEQPVETKKTYKRITTEDVIEAYAVTGLNPISESFFKSSWDSESYEPHSACAIGALYYQINGTHKDGGEGNWGESLGLSTPYVSGFIFGFDQGHMQVLDDLYSGGTLYSGKGAERDARKSEATLGFSDGQAARKIAGLDSECG